MINTDKIKELRELTQAGMMDCKKALEENKGDLELAVQWLREKGIAKAAKKMGAIATEGVVLVKVKDANAVILEVNCQTDFVAKNPEFLALSEKIRDLILTNDFKDVSNVEKTLITKTETVKTACDALTGKLGEKISLRRFAKMTKKDSQSFGAYQHTNNRVGSLLLFDGKLDQEVSKNIAMHASAMAPKFIDKTNVDQNWLQSETKVLIEQTIAEGKPKEFAEKIVRGRMSKMLAEVCLLEQQYVKDPSITIEQYLQKNNAKVISYTRYEVGEGIEKKESNFAQEVADQMNAK